MSRVESFSHAVQEKIGCYVYRLIDPRDDETFYVGKGTGNRVFAHARAAKIVTGEGGSVDDVAPDLKMDRIREILNAGFEVGTIIHRHGMSDETAFAVESALIDAYRNLTNAIGGVGRDQGMMGVEDVIRQYEAEPAEIKHRAILINVNKTAKEMPLYDAVRFSWKINKTRAANAEVILAVKHGVIVGAFVADKWLDANTVNFPGRTGDQGRVGFEGKEAPEEISRLYINKRVPYSLLSGRGAANPVRYADQVG